MAKPADYPDFREALRTLHVVAQHGARAMKELRDVTDKLTAAVDDERKERDA